MSRRTTFRRIAFEPDGQARYACRWCGRQVVSREPAQALECGCRPVQDQWGRVRPRGDRRRPAPTPRPARLTGKLAVCTCYFNPQRYQTRPANFARFRDAAIHQGADLWAIEAETGEPWEVEEVPGLHVVRLAMDSVLWQKERLLNILFDQLPAEYDRVAWVDGDILFDNPDWVGQTAAELEQYPVIQPLADSLWLNRHGTPEPCRPNQLTRQSIAYRLHLGQEVHLGKGHPGFAWAARRDALREIGGLYDRHVLGSGDSIASIGFCGPFTHPYLDRFAGKFRDVMKAWCARARQVVGGSVGYVPGTIRHLWHGERANRRYDDRIHRLALAGFNPDEHLELGPSGLWQWTDAAPTELRKLVEDYFDVRREDG